MEITCLNRGFSSLLVFIIILINNVRSEVESNFTNTQHHPRNETLHLFLVAIPESSVEHFQRLRQDEDDGPRPMSFAQTGQYLGQIIQGVLGGDVRPVFAGSLGFVEEPMANRNLNSFLGTIAPALNFALREMYLRAQVAFGFGKTTPAPIQNVVSPQKPVTQAPLGQIIYGSNSDPKPVVNISPSDFLVVEEGKNKTLTVYYAPEQQPGKQTPKLPPTSTTSWQYVLNQIYTETTTVEPLPLIDYSKIRSTQPTSIDTDDGDDDGRRLH